MSSLQMTSQRVRGQIHGGLRQLLPHHAPAPRSRRIPGWQFCPATAPGGGALKSTQWQRYVVGYFINSEGKTTPHFSAVMGFKNERGF